MSPFFTAAIVFAGVFAAAICAMRLKVALPEAHLSKESEETVKLAMGLIATLTALVLGLMIASAKGSYDANQSNVTMMASKIALLDRLLELYGPESVSARESLRQSVKHLTSRVWPSSPSSDADLTPDKTSADTLYQDIHRLSPKDDDQRVLKTQAFTILTDIGQLRWLLFEQSGPSTSPIITLVVVSWIAILFFSFGLFAPSNSTVVVALLAAAVSVAASVFLVLELDQPFGGLMQIPSPRMLSNL
ncbi:MAG: DUF4239 domain-containing protein [Planctomycetota bacterium]|nr:DUF4239 domain-containing protein [Planctomycetota bacterium]